jgi:hypothetical protein
LYSTQYGKLTASVKVGITGLAVTNRCALVIGMASLTFYIQKFGRREGRKKYNAYHRKYKKRNRDKINAARRKARKAHKQRAK